MPYFINLEFYVTRQTNKHPNLPEVVFTIPPPYSKLENPDEGILSRVPNDFSTNEDRASLYLRASKIRGSIRDDALVFAGGTYV